MDRFGKYFIRCQYIGKTQKRGPDLDANRARLTAMCVWSKGNMVIEEHYMHHQ
jgi:hypothetical protein